MNMNEDLDNQLPDFDLDANELLDTIGDSMNAVEKEETLEASGERGRTPRTSSERPRQHVQGTNDKRASTTVATFTLTPFGEPNPFEGEIRIQRNVTDGEESDNTVDPPSFELLNPLRQRIVSEEGVVLQTTIASAVSFCDNMVDISEEKEDTVASTVSYSSPKVSHRFDDSYVNAKAKFDAYLDRQLGVTPADNLQADTSTSAPYFVGNFNLTGGTQTQNHIGAIPGGAAGIARSRGARIQRPDNYSATIRGRTADTAEVQFHPDPMPNHFENPSDDDSELQAARDDQGAIYGYEAQGVKQSYQCLSQSYNHQPYDHQHATGGGTQFHGLVHSDYQGTLTSPVGLGTIARVSDSHFSPNTGLVVEASPWEPPNPKTERRKLAAASNLNLLTETQPQDEHPIQNIDEHDAPTDVVQLPTYTPAPAPSSDPWFTYYPHDAVNPHIVTPAPTSSNGRWDTCIQAESADYLSGVLANNPERPINGSSQHNSSDSDEFARV